MHALQGLGQVVGFDPPNTSPRTVRVRFNSGLGVMLLEELFSIPPDRHGTARTSEL